MSDYYLLETLIRHYKSILYWKKNFAELCNFWRQQTVMVNNFSAPFNGTSLNSTLPSVYITFHKSLAILCGTVVTINICGAFANGVTLLATITYPPLRQSSSWILLAHCMLIDFFVFLVSLAFTPGLVLVTYLGSQPFPAYFCPFWGGLTFGITFAGDWTHGILALNRFTPFFMMSIFRVSWRSRGCSTCRVLLILWVKLDSIEVPHRTLVNKPVSFLVIMKIWIGWPKFDKNSFVHLHA